MDGVTVQGLMSSPSVHVWMMWAEDCTAVYMLAVGSRRGLTVYNNTWFKIGRVMYRLHVHVPSSWSGMRPIWWRDMLSAMWHGTVAEMFDTIYK